MLNNPLKYTDPSGNAFNDGKDNGGGLSETDQSISGNGIKTIKDNLDDWGIKDWAKKNLNIKNWGKSIKKWFGGGSKGSGLPPNMSSYVSLNTSNFTGGQIGGEYSD